MAETAAFLRSIRLPSQCAGRLPSLTNRIGHIRGRESHVQKLSIPEPLKAPEKQQYRVSGLAAGAAKFRENNWGH